MPLRIKLYLPLVLTALALSAGFAGPAPGATWAALAALLAAAMGAIELMLLRPLAGLAQSAGFLGDGHSGALPGGDPIAGLAASVEAAGERMRGYEARLDREAEQRSQLEAALRDLQERYQIAVERANDGVWEWDLKSGKVDASARWQSMLGYAGGQIARIQDWRGCICPEDSEAVLMRMQNHIEGLTPYFDAEYRLRRGDGTPRWVHSRGMALRHASGKPYRVLVLDKDIHDRKLLENTLIQAAEALSSVSGETFFRALMRSLSGILGTRDNLVCHCLDDPPTRVRTLAYYSNGEFATNFEYELEGTSCGAVIERGEIVYCPTGVCNIWPLEKQYDRDSYIGVPMFDSTGKIIGHFACMDGNPLRQDLPHLAIFKIFAVRAAAELERTLLKQRLGAE